MNKLIIYILSLFVLSQFLGVFAHGQGNRIDNLKISKPFNGQVEISWTTSLPSTSNVFFGLDKDSFDFRLGNLDYKRSHKAVLTGLKKDKDYYYKIVVRDQNGRTTETFVNYFNTKDMVFTTLPNILEFNQLQVIDESAFFTFKTNREVRYEFFYGKDLEDLNRRLSSRSFKTEHDILITRHLEADTQYYFRLKVYDRDNNIRTRSGNFKTSRYSFDEIKISNLMPSFKNQAPSMVDKSIISWQSNILATSDIYYSTDPSRLRSRQRVSQDAKFDHYTVLENLEPNTTYYYQIRMRSPLNRVSFESQIYSFKTAPLSQDFLGQYFQSGDLVSHRRDTYLIHENKKVAIYSREKVNNLSQYQKIKDIDELYLNEYENLPAYHGVFFDGQVVKEENRNTVYLIDGNYRRPIANWQVFTYLNYSADDIEIASRSQIRTYKIGDEISHSNQITKTSLGALYNNKLLKSPDSPVVYLIANNQKLPFLNEEVFNRLGYCFSYLIEVDKNILNNFKLGHIII